MNEQKRKTHWASSIHLGHPKCTHGRRSSGSPSAVLCKPGEPSTALRGLRGLGFPKSLHPAFHRASSFGTGPDFGQKPHPQPLCFHGDWLGWKAQLLEPSTRDFARGCVHGGWGSNCEAFVSGSSPETGQFLIDLSYIRTDGAVTAQLSIPDGWGNS